MSTAEAVISCDNSGNKPPPPPPPTPSSSSLAITNLCPAGSFGRGLLEDFVKNMSCENNNCSQSRSVDIEHLCIFGCPDGVREYRLLLDECPQTYDGCSLEARSLMHAMDELSGVKFLNKVIDLDKCQPPYHPPEEPLP